MSRLSIRPIADRHVVFPDSRVGWHPVVNYAPAPPKPPSIDDLSADEQDSARWLFAQAGLSLEDYRNETIKRRMAACVRATGVASAGQIPSAIRRDPRLLNIALSSLMIGVTSFFRDPVVFSVLAESVLPGLLARSRSPRIWSVGCSDGAELYSIGMLLAERGALQRCALLGTDCRADAIVAARRGRYEQPSVKGVPAALLNRYLSFDGAAWEIHPYLRATTRWRAASALSVREPGAWDMILCRNMAIYMQPETAMRLWQGLEQCVRPGGVLVLGKAERPLGTKAFSPIGPCVYRRDRSRTC